MDIEKAKDFVQVEECLHFHEGQHYDIDQESILPYRHVRKLGEGASARVDEVKDVNTQKVYARKKFGIPRGKLESVQMVYQQELRVISRLKKHHHIVQVFSSYSTKTELALLLEPSADGGNLQEFLAAYNTVTGVKQELMNNILRRAYGCLANGLAFMHQQRIRHKDIKPQNILIHGESVLYTDFGVAREYPDEEYSATDGKPGPFTWFYCAPEVQLWETRCWKSDVFSLGCVYLRMYTAMFPDKIDLTILAQPFHTQVERLETALRDCRDEMPIVECLRKMLRFEMQKRPSAARVVQFLRQFEVVYYCEQCQHCLSEDGPLTSYLKEHITEWHSTKESLASPIDDVQEVAMSYTSHTSYKTDGSYMEEALNELESVNAVATLGEIESSFQVTSSHSNWPHSKMNDTIISQSSFRRPSKASKSTFFWRRYINQPSVLESLGIHKHKIVHLMRNRIEAQDQMDKGKPEHQILSEENIYSWAVEILGYGIRLSRQRPYGSIFSLSTFPVVPWSVDTILGIKNNSLEEIERAFKTGEMHPHQQDVFGESLLHVAVRGGRPDVCHLLYKYGVKASRTHNGRSLLSTAGRKIQTHRREDAIGIFEFIFHELDEPFDVEEQKFLLEESLFWPSDVIHWLWRNGNDLGLGKALLDEICLRLSLRQLHQYLPYRQAEARKELKKFLSPDIVSKIRANKLTLLKELFRRTAIFETPAFEAIYKTGSLWLSILSEIGIDIEGYIAHELSSNPESLLEAKAPRVHDRKIVATYSDTAQCWSLGWTYAVEHTPGNLVVAEFQSLGDVLEEWPFTDDLDSDSDLDPEIEREMEWKKFQREMRRLEGQDRKSKKRLKRRKCEDRLPGSWVD